MLLISCLVLAINGLTQAAPPHETPEAPTRIYHEAAIQLPDSSKTYPYRLLRPGPSGSPTPLVVFLHGAGERGSDNQGQLTYLPKWFLDAPHLKDKSCFVMAMQCPAGEQWAPYDGVRKQIGPPTPSMEALMAAIKHVIATEDVDPSRVYLTGLSMGGFGSWDLAARHPDWFAAVVPICGGGRPSSADRLKDVPIWAVHGTADRIVPERRSRQMIEAIQNVGGKPAYTALPEVGHGSWHFAYGPHGCMEWMFAQRNPDPPTFPAEASRSKLD